MSEKIIEEKRNFQIGDKVELIKDLPFFNYGDDFDDEAYVITAGTICEIEAEYISFETNFQVELSLLFTHETLGEIDVSILESKASEWLTLHEKYMEDDAE